MIFFRDSLLSQLTTAHSNSAKMKSYQWPTRGKSLVTILNYANSFAFMLYGWTAGRPSSTCIA